MDFEQRIDEAVKCFEQKVFSTAIVKMFAAMNGDESTASLLRDKIERIPNYQKLVSMCDADVLRRLRHGRRIIDVGGELLYEEWVLLISKLEAGAAWLAVSDAIGFRTEVKVAFDQYFSDLDEFTNGFTDRAFWSALRQVRKNVSRPVLANLDPRLA